MRNSLKLLGATLLVTVFVGVPAHVHGLQARAQAEAQDPHHPDQGIAPAPDAAKPAPRQRVMNQDMTKMMSEMKASDAKLDALVQAMNAAKGTEKIDAIAAVVTMLVAERRSMHTSMAAMMNMMGMMSQMSAPVSGVPAQPKP